MSTKNLEHSESKLHMKNKLLEVNDSMWIVREQAGVDCLSQSARANSERNSSLTHVSGKISTTI